MFFRETLLVHSIIYFYTSELFTFISYRPTYLQVNLAFHLPR